MPKNHLSNYFSKHLIYFLSVSMILLIRIPGLTQVVKYALGSSWLYKKLVSYMKTISYLKTLSLLFLPWGLLGQQVETKPSHFTTIWCQVIQSKILSAIDPISFGLSNWQTRRHGRAFRGRAPPNDCLCPPKWLLVPPKQGLCPEEINRLGAAGVQIWA